MKLSKLIENKEPLQTLIKCPLPLGIAWDLKKAVKTMDVELQLFEELRNGKIIELGEKSIDNDGQEVYRVKGENLKQFNGELMELLEKDIDIEFPVIKFDSIKNCKDAQGNLISLSTKDLLLLDWLIVE